MTATITRQHRPALTPAISMFLALVAIVIGVIALATASSHTSTVVPAPSAAPTVTAPSPAAIATGPGIVPRVSIPGGYVVQAGIGGADRSPDCRGKRVGTVC